MWHRIIAQSFEIKSLFQSRFQKKKIKEFYPIVSFSAVSSGSSELNAPYI